MIASSDAPEYGSPGVPTGAMMNGTSIGENDTMVRMVELDGKTYRVVSHNGNADGRVSVQIERRLSNGTIYRFFRGIKAGTPQAKKVLAK